MRNRASSLAFVMHVPGAGTGMRTAVRRCALVIAIVMLGATTTGAAQLQPVVTERIADVTLRVLVEGGKLLIGPNDIVLEFGPSSGERDVSGVTLVAMRAGTASVPVNVDLSPEAAGRFHGTMILPWTDNCRLEVRWRDDHGHHRHAFTVPVIVGHH